jgi:predicted transcriptional regulator
MQSALADIQLLANSENRIRVLDALTDESATRQQLQEVTGVPRSSTARVLEEAESHGWVESNGSQYRITASGEAMVVEIRRTIAATKGIQHLGEAIEWLPDPVHQLGFRHFKDAQITLPTQANPTAALDLGLDRISDASTYRGLTRNALPQYTRLLCNRVEAGDLDFEGVIEERFMEVLRDDPERAEIWSVIAEQMWVFDGHVPINMHLVDDTALIWLCEEDEEGNEVVPKGLLETENPHVVSWAESFYEEYLEAAKPLSLGRIET